MRREGPNGPISSLTAEEQIARQPHGHVTTCSRCFHQWWAGPGDLPLGLSEKCSRIDCPQLEDVEAKAERRALDAERYADLLTPELRSEMNG